MRIHPIENYELEHVLKMSEDDFIDYIKSLKSEELSEKLKQIHGYIIDMYRQSWSDLQEIEKAKRLLQEADLDIFFENYGLA